MRARVTVGVRFNWDLDLLDVSLSPLTRVSWIKLSATCCLCLCEETSNFLTISSFSVGASIPGDQKKMDRIATASSVPLLLPWPWKCPQGLQCPVRGRLAVYGGMGRGFQVRECMPPSCDLCPLCQVEHPTGGSVMTFVCR